MTNRQQLIAIITKLLPPTPLADEFIAALRAYPDNNDDENLISSHVITAVLIFSNIIDKNIEPSKKETQSAFKDFCKKRKPTEVNLANPIIDMIKELDAKENKKHFNPR